MDFIALLLLENYFCNVFQLYIYVQLLFSFRMEINSETPYESFIHFFQVKLVSVRRGRGVKR
jgi:hypothetical protein